MQIEMKDNYRYTLYYDIEIGSATVSITYPFYLSDMEAVKRLGDLALKQELGLVPDCKHFLKYEVSKI
jgi:hypothetical protein